jgi:hypothetical protein
VSQIARDLTRRLVAAGVDTSVLIALVSDMATTRAAAINREGLHAQIAYLLEAYGPGEIESFAFGNQSRERRW